MAKQTLTVQLMHANARIAELETQLAAAKAPRSNVRPAYVAPARVVPEWQQARIAAMAAARAEAARTGRCVRVA